MRKGISKAVELLQTLLQNIGSTVQKELFMERLSERQGRRRYSGARSLTLGCQSLDEVCVRRDSIHPSPPTKMQIWLDDTVEEHQKREEKTEQNAHNLCCGTR